MLRRPVLVRVSWSIICASQSKLTGPSPAYLHGRWSGSFGQQPEDNEQPASKRNTPRAAILGGDDRHRACHLRQPVPCKSSSPLLTVCRLLGGREAVIMAGSWL